MGNTDKIVEYLDECRQMKIEIRPPNINHSEGGFSVEDGTIWYGIEAVKGLGGKVVDTIVSERESSGKYKTIFDLSSRVDSKQGLNKSALETLVSCGALDDFGQNRAQLAAVVETAVSRGNSARKDRESGQLDLFSMGGAPGDSNASGGLDDEYPEAEDWSEKERLTREKQTLGFYLTGHPLERWRGVIDKYATHTLGDLATLKDGAEVKIAVQVSKVTKKVSKKTGDPFWIALVEDRHTAEEIFVGKKDYEKVYENLVADALLFFIGKVRYRDTTPGLRLKSFVPIEDVPSMMTSDVSMLLSVDDESAEDLLFRLKDALQNHRGKCPVILVFRDGNGANCSLMVGPENHVHPTLEFLDRMDELCGPGRVFVNRNERLVNR